MNDQLGHEEGNQCLLRAVKLMSAAVLHKDKLYRWGGDEFAVILPNFDTDEAVAVAERIRASIDKTNPGGSVKVTASIGVATSQASGINNAASLEDWADKAMYKAKEVKNRVAVTD